MKFSRILLFSLMLFVLDTNAQLPTDDLLLIKNKAKHYQTFHKKKIRKYTPLYKPQNNTIINKLNPISLTFSGLLFFYQNILSSQINAGCLYSPSCSEFSKNSIRKYGLFKGIFLTADRLHRCNRITALDIKENSSFRLSDPIELYNNTHD